MEPWEWFLLDVLLAAGTIAMIINDDPHTTLFFLIAFIVCIVIGS